jgi:transposase
MHEANIQDRDGAPGVISLTCASFPCFVHVFADGGHAVEKLKDTLAKVGDSATEIVKGPDDAKGFFLVARRWVVERTLAWVNRCRRLAKDWEATIASYEAWLIIASIRQL